MFGKSSQSNGSHPPPHRSAADMAQIKGGGLVQLIVSEVQPLNFALFLNEKSVSQIDVESLSVDIELPDDSNAQSTIVRATLSRYAVNVTGERTLQRTELFPCTVEIVALGRRIIVTCMNTDSTDGLWVNLGLKPDGDSEELHGLQTFRFLMTQELLDAKITWVDGGSDDLLPQ